MEESTSREKILKKVRAALIHKSRSEGNDVDLESNVYDIPDEAQEIIFAQEFSEAGGQFVFCENDTDFLDNLTALISDGSFGRIWCGDEKLSALLKSASIPHDNQVPFNGEAQTTITGCEHLVARTGSVVMSSRQVSGRKSGVLTDFHIVVARTSQLVLNNKDALRSMKGKYSDGLPSLVTFITGPSRSADIEKTLVQGAHGAKEIFVFLIDDVAEISF